MNLTKVPDFVSLPPAHYVYVEKVGPFADTAPAAWAEVQRLRTTLGNNVRVVGLRSLFRMKPEMRYCAGYLLAKALDQPVEGGSCLDWEGGRFAKFTLSGPYANMGPAWGEVMNAIETLGLDVRDGYFVENYVNDPSSAPPDRLVTELMVPVT